MKVITSNCAMSRTNEDTEIESGCSVNAEGCCKGVAPDDTGMGWNQLGFHARF